MRGGYPLALPYLSTSHPASAAATGPPHPLVMLNLFQHPWRKLNPTQRKIGNYSPVAVIQIVLYLR